MSYSASSGGRARRAHRNFRFFGLLLGVVGTALIAVTPSVAEAFGAELSAAGMCHQVSAASVAAIVGFSVPAATPAADNLKATKQNDDLRP